MLDTTMPDTTDDGVDDDETAQWLQAAVAGDVPAYEQIYRRHAPRLFATVWRLCGGQQARAEDVLQEAFLQAWKALPGFRGECSLGTWLHRLAVNAALMDMRGGAVQPHEVLEQDDPLHEAFVVRDPCAGTERDLERALARLPARARAVLVLHDIEGWKHHEIATQLQIAVGSSKAHLHRARGLLRAWLGDMT